LNDTLAPKKAISVSLMIKKLQKISNSDKFKIKIGIIYSAF